ncbi:MAG: UDP-N-acetylmuramoyl-L-alanine--D-glutamate ligase [Clostridia bacterium]|nr:UDP-N-acetylmuramoyl-L-alanine--D-glutamate ligase [Clostridia bacterium]
MTDDTSFFGKRVCLLGLGVSNLALLDFLAARGARLSVRECRAPDTLPLSVAELCGRGVRLICGEGYLDNIDEDILFRSPGMRPDLPPLAAAVAKGAVLYDEIQLFCARSPATLLGVTGSDGKTTTTALAAHLLRHARRDRDIRVALGGNIGTPLIGELPHLRSGDLAVAELSSFQLMTQTKPPARAVITNITENHLNWHRGMAEYIEAKKRILGEATHAILNAENDITAMVARERANLTLFSSRRTRGELVANFGACHTVTRERGMLCYDGKELFPAHVIPLPGIHNLENVMAAVGLVFPYVDANLLREAVASFLGVSHRLQLIATVDGVRYFDSSIDSTPTRTAAALAALDTSPILLCGGRGKGLSFSPLARAVRGRVRVLLLFGEAREEIGQAMCEADVPYLSFPTMGEAVLAAKAMAREGDVVLLSPACTSFDEFRNFEDRGDTFRRLVLE